MARLDFMDSNIISSLKLVLASS